MRKDNDLLREALIRDRNEVTKQMYLDKITPPNMGQPDGFDIEEDPMYLKWLEKKTDDFPGE